MNRQTVISAKHLRKSFGKGESIPFSFVVVLNFVAGGVDNVKTSASPPAMERSRRNKVPLCIKNANGAIVKKLLTAACHTYLKLFGKTHIIISDKVLRKGI